MKIILCGDYQFAPLYQALGHLNPSELGYELQMVSRPKLDELLDEIGAGDILVYQITSVDDSVPDVHSTAEVLSVPQFKFKAFWPYATEAHPRNASSAHLPHGAFPVALSSSRLNALMSQGRSEKEILDEYLAANALNDVDFANELSKSLGLIKALSAKSSINLYSEIEARLLHEQLFDAFNAPAWLLTNLVLDAVFARLDIGVSEDEVRNAISHTKISHNLPVIQAPIHPAVIDAYGIKWADGETRYRLRSEGEFTFAEFVKRYIHYEVNDTGELAQWRLTQGDDSGEALELLEGAVENYGCDPRTLLMLIRRYTQEGSSDKLAGLLQRARNELADDSRIWFHSALFSLAIGDDRQARDYIDQAIALDENYAEYHRNKAIIANALGDGETVIAELDAAKRLAPRSAKVLNTNKHYLPYWQGADHRTELVAAASNDNMLGVGFPSFVRTLDDPVGSYIEPAAQKLTFHHIQKTAGSTFRRMLESLFERSEVCPGEIDKEVVELTEDEIKKFKLYAGHYKYDLLEDYLSQSQWVVFFRDPIERTISTYSMYNNAARHDDKWKARAENEHGVMPFLEAVREMSLEEFVDFDHPRAKDLVSNRQARYLVRATPYIKSCPVYDKEIVEEAKKNLREKFVFCGILEDFDLSMSLFSMTFGINPFGPSSSYTTNINPKKSFNQKYEISQQLRDKLYNLNRMDYEIIDYARSLMYERIMSFSRHLLKAPLAVDVASELCVQNSQEAKVSSVECNAESFGIDKGFHWLEKDLIGRRYRWTGMDNPAVVDVAMPLKSGDSVRVEIQVLDTIDAAALENLTITLAGFGPHKSKLSNSIHCHKAKFDVTIGDDIFPVKNHLLKLYVPNGGVKCEDGRKLGVAVSKIKIKKVDNQ